MTLAIAAIMIAAAGSLALLVGLRSLAARGALLPEAALAPADQLRRLSELPTTERARVERLDDQCEGLARRRLLDFGLTPGVAVERELTNAFDSAGVYRVRGTLLALRRDQADHIWVRPMA
jgi:Fe2+ transport system protein FeoA